MPRTNGKKVELFLDSGAFSAWSQNTKIDIKKYIKFIKKNEKVIDVYANLDVIGSAKGTWKNQLKMEKAGLKPLPVFHVGEDFSYLKRYIKKYDYLALGGMVGKPKPELKNWLNKVWPLLCDKHGMPKLKIHGFGLTSLTLMLRYPWYSVDSTSWVVTGRMGSIYIPRFKDGKWNYLTDSWKIAVSNMSPDQKKAGAHISTLSPMNKEIILKYIHEKGYKLGESTFREVEQTYKPKKNEKWAEKKPKDKNKLRKIETVIVPGVSNKYQLRDEMNIIYFLDLEKAMPKWPWAFKPNKQTSLF